MYGTAVPNGELVRGWSHAYYFVLSSGTVDTTKTLWIGPDFQITKTAPALVQDGSSNRWSCALSPDEAGTWTLVVCNSSNSVLHTVSFRCVDAPGAYHALGVQTSYRGLVEIWPKQCTPDLNASQIRNGTGTPIRSFLSIKKFVVPYTGYIYGIKLYTYSTSNTVNSLRFFTFDRSTNLVRGISENLITRTDISWQTNNLTTILFAKPVRAHAGDSFGFEIDDTTANGATFVLARVACNANTADNQEIQARTGALNLNSANTSPSFSTFGTGTMEFFRCRLLMNPPVIGIAGLSHWAGSPDSVPICADRSGAYVAAQDMAAMLSEILGVPCVNLAWGGTDIRNWVGSYSDATLNGTVPIGLFEKVVVGANGFYPAALVYDAIYNDANGGFGREDVSGFTSVDYLGYLDRLLAHCDAAGIELVILEAFGSKYAVDNLTLTGGLDFSAQIEKLNTLAAAWCQQNGVLHIPLNYRLGRYEGTKSEHLSRRYAQKILGTTYPSDSVLDYQASDKVHLTASGRKAAAMAIAAAFRNRRFGEPRTFRPLTKLDNLLPPDSAQQYVLSAAQPKSLFSPPPSNPGTGTLTFYAEDGTTAIRVFTVTTDAGGNVLTIN